MPVTDTPFFFGDSHQLFGIVSEPSNGKPRKTGIVVLNSGLVHRSGPFRMGVEISRELASHGFPVLRFDQSAHGDSDRRSGTTVVDAANLDIDMAKEALRSFAGVENIVLAGLCSGADDVLRYCATADDILGSILMDPFAVRTPGYTFHHLAPRLLSLPHWRRFVGRKLVSLGKSEGSNDNNFDLAAIREFPTPEQACRAFRKMAEIGGASLCVFTGGVEDYYNHKGQLINGLGLSDISDQIDEVFYKSAGHTYPLKFHRDTLVKTIADFCETRYQ